MMRAERGMDEVDENAWWYKKHEVSTRDPNQSQIPTGYDKSQ